jgi:hypothetical protein
MFDICFASPFASFQCTLSASDVLSIADELITSEPDEPVESIDSAEPSPSHPISEPASWEKVVALHSAPRPAQYDYW